jgi:23S rRNA maturation-related 3'-5' exoribonuclease YhaM
LESKKNVQIRKGDHYFVIREARKTLEINYRLTQQQAEDIEGKSQMQVMNLTGKNIVYLKEQQVINQKFNKPMRVMFFAEEIKFNLDGNELKIVR